MKGGNEGEDLESIWHDALCSAPSGGRPVDQVQELRPRSPGLGGWGGGAAQFPAIFRQRGGPRWRAVWGNEKPAGLAAGTSFGKPVSLWRHKKLWNVPVLLGRAPLALYDTNKPVLIVLIYFGNLLALWGLDNFFRTLF